MRQPNPARSIANLGQSFAQQQRKPVSGLADPHQSIQESMQELALEIYARLISVEDAPDAESMGRIAERSRKAAQVYYESMGVCFEHG